MDVINSTLAKVTWSAVPKDSVRGHLRGYQVCVGAPGPRRRTRFREKPERRRAAGALRAPCPPQVSWWKTRSLLDGRAHPKRANVLRFSGQRNFGMVPSLDAFSEFRLTVSAYNSRGAGPESEPHAFRTPEGGGCGGCGLPRVAARIYPPTPTPAPRAGRWLP